MTPLWENGPFLRGSCARWSWKQAGAAEIVTTFLYLVLRDCFAYISQV